MWLQLNIPLGVYKISSNITEVSSFLTRHLWFVAFCKIKLNKINNLWNHAYMRCVPKVSTLIFYLSRQKGTLNETFIFFKIISLLLSTLIPVSLTLVEASLKPYFWNVVHLCYRNSFNVLCMLKSWCCDEFLVKENKKKVTGVMSGECSGCCTCAILCSTKKWCLESRNWPYNFFYRLAQNLVFLISWHHPFFI